MQKVRHNNWTRYFWKDLCSFLEKRIKWQQSWRKVRIFQISTNWWLFADPLVRFWYAYRPTKKRIRVLCVIEVFSSEKRWRYSKSVKFYFIKLLCVFIVHWLRVSIKNVALLEYFRRKIFCWSVGVLELFIFKKIFKSVYIFSEPCKT